MWNIHSVLLENGKVAHYKISENNKTLSYQTFIERLKNQAAFRTFFNQVLSESPYDAYFWEVKPITKQQVTDDFEFVLVNSTILPKLRANKSAFQQYFDKDKQVVSFPNLGGDAFLVVPVAQGPEENYTHLSSFVRNAATNQIDPFWQTVAIAYEKMLGDAPKWLSTAGLGVYWLHIRIDSRPKYYRYKAYKISG